MKKSLLLLLISLIFATILLSFGSLSVLCYEEDQVDIEDWYDTKTIPYGSYWVIELVSHNGRDYIYDIIAESSQNVDFLIMDSQGLTDFDNGINFYYISTQSSLNTGVYTSEIPIKKISEKILLIIDNSNKVNGGANSGQNSEIGVWISPRKDPHISFEEIPLLLGIIFLIAMGFGGGFVLVIKYVRDKRKKAIFEELEALNISTGESIIDSIRNTRLREEKDAIFKRFSDQTGKPLKLLEEKYYRTEFCLTPYGYERNGLIIILSSIVLTYIGAFLYVVIERNYYLGGKVFDDYLILWPGLGLFVIGIVLFIIGSYLLEIGWKDCSMKKRSKKRFNYLFLIFISIQFIIMLNTLFIVENLFGPWGGLFYPWIAIFLTLYSGSRVLRVIGKNATVPSAPTQPMPFFTTHQPSFQPSHPQNIPQTSFLPNQPSQPNIKKSKGLIPKSAYEENFTQKPPLFCPHCGEKNLKANTFCRSCGKFIK